MRKLKPLTTQQKKLLEENYSKIKSILTNLIRNSKNKNGFHINIEDAISYIVEACSEWDGNLAKMEVFPNFIALMCYYRYIDQYRISQKTRRKTKVFVKSSPKLDCYPSSVNDYTKTDSKDFVRNLVNKSNLQFDIKNISNKKNMFSNLRICKALINDYIVPNVEDDANKKIKEISKEFNISQKKLFKVMNSAKVKNFLKDVYNGEQ